MAVKTYIYRTAFECNYHDPLQVYLTKGTELALVAYNVSPNNIHIFKLCLSLPPGQAN